MFARIKPYSPRHGRTTRRFSLGGSLFVEGYSSAQMKSQWYVVSDDLADILDSQRNERDKKIFDVVSEEQARAIDVQEGNPYGTQRATRVHEDNLRLQPFTPAEYRPDQGQAPLWRYDPDAESVPELPPGFLDGNTTVSAPPQASPPRLSHPTKSSSATKSGAEGAWDDFDQEQRVSTVWAAKRSAQELVDATPSEDEAAEEPAPKSAAPAEPTDGEVAKKPRRRGDAV